jgi:uncharacterized membrane protein HdeD (DUF308 family)
MTINESKTDRIIRVVLGVALFALGLFGEISPTLGIVLMIIGGIAIITGAIGFCPLYSLFKFRTNK